MCDNPDSCRLLPPERQPTHHAEADLKGTQIIRVSAFADTDTWMKSNRTLDDDELIGERHIHEMGVEFQIDGRVEARQQSSEGLKTAELEGRTDVGERASAEVLGFQEL